MKTFMMSFFIIVLLSVLTFAQEEKNVLVEGFLNAHCPLCPPAHTALDQYNQNSANADKVNFIHYDMVYPYSDDPLYQYNKSDSDGRNSFYNPSGITPIVFFDGIRQGSNYSSWGSQLDALLESESPIKIVLTGSRSDNSFDIKAEVSRSGDVADNNLTINFVLVENVNYQGRNGVAYHRNVMRKMVTSPTGESFSIAMGETKPVDKKIDIDTDNLIMENLSVVVFIQSSSSKTVYQSGTITYSELTITDVTTTNEIPSEYSLEQNYPNPFNPTTKIRYTIAPPTLPEGEASVGTSFMKFITLKVYDILGNEIATLVNEEKPAGDYEVEFGRNLIHQIPSGVYFYTMNAGSFTQTKKMLLLK